MGKDEKKIELYLGLIQTVQELAQLYATSIEDHHPSQHDYKSKIVECLSALKQHAEETEKEIPLAKTAKFIDSAIDSFARLSYAEHKIRKLEFEFYPILRECYNYLYYFGLVDGNEVRKRAYLDGEFRFMHGNTYVDEAERTGTYKYDLSICVLAYNKLDYTKLCVDSVLRNLPKKYSYELIFINHGSDDGTKEFFESIKPDKQLDIAINGGGLDSEYKICEGKYYLRISNDVIVTENAIDNMLRLMEEDETVAYIVPSTPNITNQQTIKADYTTLEELAFFCHNNNIYNPSRHEQRTRLMSPLFMFRSSVMLGSQGLLPDAYLGTADNISFNDDRFSLVVRRAGYKAILMKDAYCYHFGSVTVNEEDVMRNQEKYYLEGRKKFYKGFGIDPWGIGMCYDSNIIDRIPILMNDSCNILGINCGQGSYPLKLKERQIEHGFKATMDNITNQKNYLPDLAGLSDLAIYDEQLDVACLGGNYDYIVWEDGFNGNIELLNKVINKLKANGLLIIKYDTRDEELMINVTIEDAYKIAESWLIIKK